MVDHGRTFVVVFKDSDGSKSVKAFKVEDIVNSNVNNLIKALTPREFNGE